MFENKEDKNVKSQHKQGLEAPKILKILVTIVPRPKADFFVSALEEFDVNMQTVCYGSGTAPTEILSYLGMNTTEKVVIFSVVKEEKVKEILTAYEDKYFKIRNAKGIAFTIPVSSIIGVTIYKFLANLTEKELGV